MVVFKNIQLLFSKVFTKAKNVVGATVKLARRIHSHNYLTEPYSAKHLEGSSDVALKNHTHPYIAKSELVDGFYRLEDAESLSGYEASDFAKAYHQHDYVPNPNHTIKVLEKARAGDSTIVVFPEPKYSVYAVGNTVIQIESYRKSGGWYIATLVKPLGSDINPNTELKAIRFVPQAYFLHLNATVKPDSVFDKTMHSHHGEYYTRGERVAQAKRLDSRTPFQIASRDHTHPYYVPKHTTRYMPKDIVAHKTRSIDYKNLVIVNASTLKGVTGIKARIDLLEAMGADITEIPASAYARSLSPSMNVYVYYDAAEAVQQDTASTSPTTFKLQMPALQFLQELSNHFSGLLPYIPQTIFSVSVYPRFFTHLVARQSVATPDIVVEAHVTLGGPGVFDDQTFKSYTEDLQRTLLVKAAQYVPVINRVPDLMKHFWARLRGISGNYVVVENRGFPYSLVVYTKRTDGVKYEDTAFTISD